tara:strand:+ start:6613 stop:6960 length:348 start_codon:yes stop_codon:yes gene_type:complete
MLKLFFYVLLVFLQSPIIQDINKDQVINILNKKNVYVIDVRTEREFNHGNIIDSHNIDYLKSDFVNNLNMLDKEKEYLIYCRSGNRSEKASLIMKSLGFKYIYHYKKGYNDWVKD